VTSLRFGARSGLPVAVPLAAVALSFGALAHSMGWGVVLPTVMSLVVFSATGQFTAAAILGSGGGIVAACSAAILVNARFVPMGFAVAPSLHGGRLRRALEGQVVVDAGLVLARRADGSFDRAFLFGFFAAMIPAWVGGTFAGAALAHRAPDLEKFGIDAVFPMFFVALLIDEVRSDSASRTISGASALVALLLVPVTPAGVPIVAASLIALIATYAR
jgi:predicted branched-subunit amino acid permease